MNHRSSAVMLDRDGRFQRCWECGGRRRVGKFGSREVGGIWDTSLECGPQEEVEAPTRPEPTQQELIDELF